ncbi:peroxiredoxin [Pseudomonas sp. DTU_2021_1001937_2_SI_NGA_ILE_001]|uniref:peroxiredoxin n=1 Tax=Pseudomonas sp. DTU_2021_1001937_2_SI_NGA_ILE_001 TaxID=3077589 RepID=UPI0028FC29A6|nr:peroxiredoxin [Pseudomonas sp. DTU_2021_1001937_2_SI_NGA_ILE_001]WNW09896.1 peroxiredoxin [Pseudomonas sp. DTU_2021_1001937_2_SI_NGA_ILE_001]
MTLPDSQQALRDRLIGQPLPSTTLPATDGQTVDLSRERGLCVVFIYPRSGNPHLPAPAEMASVPGAKGCTPQACGFRDHFQDFAALGVAGLFGLSSQDTAYQQELVERIQLPYPLLSDPTCQLGEALGLPLYQAGPIRVYGRAALVIDNGRVAQLFSDIPDPANNAGQVLDWLRQARC